MITSYFLHFRLILSLRANDPSVTCQVSHFKQKIIFSRQQQESGVCGREAVEVFLQYRESDNIGHQEETGVLSDHY